MSQFTLTAMPLLTREEARTLAFIMEYVEEHGAPPPLEVLQKRFDWASHNTGARQLTYLRRKGYLETPNKFTPRAARRVRVLANPEGQRVKLAFSVMGAGNANR